MIKLGRMTNPGRYIIKEINKAKNLGFDYVEIGIEVPNDFNVLRNFFKISGTLKTWGDFQ